MRSTDIARLRIAARSRYGETAIVEVRTPVDTEIAVLVGGVQRISVVSFDERDAIRTVLRALAVDDETATG